MREGKIIGLDGIRAIAVLMVIFSHHAIYESLGIIRAEHPEFARLVNPQQGVKIFFVLSGFLITYLLIRENEKFGRIDLKKFYMRRILRLLPLYYLAITLVLIMHLIGAAPIKDKAFFYLYTYTQNFQPIEYNYMSTGHLWSLAVEEHFYLVWPLLFLISWRLAVTFAVVFIGLALRYGSGFDVHWTFPAALGIAAGCLLAFIIRTRVVQRTFSFAWLSYVILAFSFLGLFSPWWGYRDIYFVPAVMGLIAFIVLNQESWLSRMLELKPLALIGVMSYGAYVWHAVLGGTGSYRAAGTLFPVDVKVGFVLTWVVVPMSYYGFEKPFLNLKDRFRQSTNESTVDAQSDPNATLNSTVGNTAAG